VRPAETMGAHPSAVGRLAFITVSGHVYAPSGRRRRVPAAVTSVLPSIPSGRVGHDPCCHTHSRRAARRASPLGVDGGAGDEAVGGLWSRGHKRTVPVAVFGLGCMPAALSLSVLGAGIAIGVAGAIFEVMLNVMYGSVRLGTRPSAEWMALALAGSNKGGEAACVRMRVFVCMCVYVCVWCVSVAWMADAYEGGEREWCSGPRVRRAACDGGAVHLSDLYVFSGLRSSPAVAHNSLFLMVAIRSYFCLPLP